MSVCVAKQSLSLLVMHLVTISIVCLLIICLLNWIAESQEQTAHNEANYGKDDD